MFENVILFHFGSEYKALMRLVSVIIVVRNEHNNIQQNQ